MLQLKNITKDYVLFDGVHNVLKGINLSFRNSEFVSILGPSGCGKTTMLNIIGGLDKYSSGDLIIDGKISLIMILILIVVIKLVLFFKVIT